MSDRLPWFRCVPSALLGAMAGLQPDESLIYVTVIMRIYEVGGPIADNARTLGRRTGLTIKRAGAAIEDLAMAGKITILSDDRIDSHSTHAELGFQRDTRADKSEAGKASAEARSRRAKIDEIAKGDKRVVRFPSKKDVKKQRSGATSDGGLFNKKDIEEEDNSSLPPAPKTAISPDWIPDEEDQRVALSLGVLERDLEREGRVFRDRCLEQDFRSANWRASWRRFLSHYRPSSPTGPPGHRNPSRGRPVSGYTAVLMNEAEKFAAEEPRGDFARVPGSDPDEILVLDDGADDEPEGHRGEMRGIAYASGGGSGPSDAVLRAAGFGGNDGRALRALRRSRTPSGGTSAA
jgi:uncharacterized protein YdaU (DUF1376 family)